MWKKLSDECMAWFPYVHLLSTAITSFENQMDETAVADYKKACVSTLLLIQDFLDQGDLGDAANRSLADYHMTLTRKWLSLSRKTRAFHQQKAAQEAERIACEKYADMDEEEFFTLYESKLG